MRGRFFSGARRRGGDDLQGAAAVRAVFNVDIEDPFEQHDPTDARRRALRVSLPWTSAEYEDITVLMTTDYWPYGVEPNRENLETLHGYLFEQGLIKQKLVLDELFARETVEAFKI